MFLIVLDCQTEMAAIKQSTRCSSLKCFIEAVCKKKIMCIPIICISCVKILKMYRVKNSFTLMVIGCFHIPVPSTASGTAFPQDRKKSLVF